jgi:hypothetical protein
VAAREGDGRGPEPSDHGDGRAASDHRAGFGSDGDDDAGGCRAERAGVMLVVVARHDVLPGERVVAGAVALGGHPKAAGLGAGWSAKPGGIGPWWADQRDEFRHRRAGATAVICLMDVRAADRGAGGGSS